MWTRDRASAARDGDTGIVFSLRAAARARKNGLERRARRRPSRSASSRDYARAGRCGAAKSPRRSIIPLRRNAEVGPGASLSTWDGRGGKGETRRPAHAPSGRAVARSGADQRRRRRGDECTHLGGCRRRKKGRGGDARRSVCARARPDGFIIALAASGEKGATRQKAEERVPPPRRRERRAQREGVRRRGRQ